MLESIPFTDPKESLDEESIEIRKESPTERKLRYASLLGIILGTTIGSQNDGIAATWPNVFASDMEHNGSTIHNTTLYVSDSEMDFMSSSYFIGTLPAIIVSGFLVTWLGRRRTMIAASIPGVISWVLIGIAPNNIGIFAGRLLCGVAHGILGIAVRSYLAEVTDARFRGAAGITTETMKGIGGIAIIVLGIFIPWYYVAIFCGCHFFIYGAIVVPSLPESPSHLIVKGREDDALKILRKLKGPYVDLEDMVKTLKKENKFGGENIRWIHFFKPNILKRYFIVAGLFFIGNFSGVEVIRGNATRMLQSSSLALNQDISTVIIFVVLLFGNVIQTILLDYIGRRKCLVMSMTCMVFAYTVLGTHAFLKSSAEKDMKSLVHDHNSTLYNITRFEIEEQGSWIPTLSIMTAAFGSSLGIGPIPWLLSAEYFPTAIRPQVLAVCSLTANICTIAALQLYSPLLTLLTSTGLYFCYASFSALGIIFTVVFVYETRGCSIG